MEVKIEEDVFLATVIGSLPADYGNVMETWELAAKSEQTKQNQIAKLLNKEAYLKQNMAADEHAFAMRVKQTDKFRSLPIEEQKKISRCANCQKKGHWYKECPEKRTRVVSGMVLNTGELCGYLKHRWILDSGTTNHMSNNQAWFTNLKMFEEPLQVKMGDGTKISVLGEGNIKF